MLNFIQIPNKLEYYECDEITGRLNDFMKVKEYFKPWSYLCLFETSKNFKINDTNSKATFSIRYPGRTLGHITVNGYGVIIESEFYPSNMNTDKEILAYKKIFKAFTVEYKMNLSTLAEIQFVQSNLKFCPKANKQILYFIANFLYHCGVDADEIIREQFRAGYCLHFAMILEKMFPGGEICWCAPYGHMVYMHDGIPYDIEGINTSDCDYYIPISFIKDGIKDFMHVPGVAFNASEEYIKDAIERYKVCCLHTENHKDVNYDEIIKDGSNG
jgi:hypothetical protein